MNENNSKDTQNEQAAHPHESEADAAKRRAGKLEHSSHEHMSREKAGTHEGAGGGAKQKQNH